MVLGQGVGGGHPVLHGGVRGQLGGRDGVVKDVSVHW